MRNGQPALAHKPKDFCTIEQASYIAQQVIRDAPLIIEPDVGYEGSVSVIDSIRILQSRIEALESAHRLPWYRRLFRRKHV